MSYLLKRERKKETMMAQPWHASAHVLKPPMQDVHAVLVDPIPAPPLLLLPAHIEGDAGQRMVHTQDEAHALQDRGPIHQSDEAKGRHLALQLRDGLAELHGAQQAQQRERLELLRRHTAQQHEVQDHQKEVEDEPTASTQPILFLNHVF